MTRPQRCLLLVVGFWAAIGLLAACSWGAAPNGLSNANPGRIGLVAPVAGGASVVYNGRTLYGSDPTAGSYTFSSVAIGTAAADRLVLVAVHLRAGGTLSAVTIGGVSATQVATSASGSSPIFTTRFYIAAVPTGTAADVGYTISATANHVTIGCWSLYGLSATPVDTGFAADGTSASDTLTTVAGGFVFGALAMGNDATGSAVTWNNGLTGAKDYEVDADEADDDGVSGAHAATTGTSTTVGVTGIGGANFTATVFASFGPP